MGSSRNVVTVLRARRPQINSRQGRGFSLLHSLQTGCGAHSASCVMGNGDSFSWGYNGQGQKLTNHIHLVSRLRKRGGIPPLNTYYCLVLNQAMDTALQRGT